MIKKFIALTFFVFSLLTIMPYNTAHASGEVDFDDVATYLDDFMIKSDFVLDESKYRVIEKSTVNSHTTYKLRLKENLPYDFFEVLVYKNKIVTIRYFFDMPGATNKQISKLVAAKGYIITTRYGNPTTFKLLDLSGDSDNLAMAHIYRGEYYTYHFGAYKQKSQYGILVYVARNG